MAAKQKRRGPSIEDKFLGPEPNYHGVEIADKDLNVEYSKGSHWYNYFNNAKINVPAVLEYCKNDLGYSADDIKILKRLPDYKLNLGIGIPVKMHLVGFPLERMGVGEPKGDYKNRIKTTLAAMFVEAQQLAEQVDNKPKPVVIPIQQRMHTKVMETIYADWDQMVVDKWQEGIFEGIIFPTYSLLQLHKIKGAAVNMFASKIQFEHDLVSDAYNKTCEQAVEAYSHIKKGNLKKMIVTMDKVFADIQRMKDNNKVTRVPKTKKPKTSDAQIKNLKYLAKDDDAQLVSINPVMIPGKSKLWVYNAKTRVIHMYVSDSTTGFEVKGSTVYKWDEKMSMCTKLRKPEDLLPQILTKTEKQIDKALKALTTKVSIPTGRVNKDCILLRVL
jgi:hypothetical protein|tara:strand:+ start:4650 stop:5810 length:1161 start_codon:yes stop_codon:yes gene_type:complete